MYRQGISILGGAPIARSADKNVLFKLTHVRFIPVCPLAAEARRSSVLDSVAGYNDARVGAALSHCSTAWRVLPIAEACSRVSLVSCKTADNGTLPFFWSIGVFCFLDIGESAVYSGWRAGHAPPFWVLDAAYDD